MNGKRIIFSGIMSSLIGLGLGLVLAHVFQTPYRAIPIYQNQRPKYMIIGAVAGLILGSSQEAVRQLKQESDRQNPQ